MEHIDFHFCPKGHVVFDRISRNGTPILCNCRRKECRGMCQRCGVKGASLRVDPYPKLFGDVARVRLCDDCYKLVLSHLLEV